jgi:lipopolysaccharide export system protein LptA
VRITIERIRTAVLIAGVLLIVVLGTFLTLGRWRSPFNRRDLPKKLGIDIQQEANGFTQAGFRAGHATFRITASKVEQLKDDRYRLHVVKIEMYDPTEGTADRIEGSEFEYDQQAGIAKAAGPVEITLDRPHGDDEASPHRQSRQKNPDHPKPSAAPPALPGAAADQIHVRTSGLTFNQTTGVATTNEHVDFDLAQGSGSSLGASYDSQNGRLVLDRSVELNARRGEEPVHLRAQHAEIDRDTNVCRLESAKAEFRNGSARAEQASILFREDGTAVRLDASHGFQMTTADGGSLAAPTGRLDFDDQNQPRVGHLEGGVTIDSETDDRTVHGTAPTADLDFDGEGMLRHAHLERNVHFVSDQETASASGQLRVHRDWKSSSADLAFRNSSQGQQLALDSIHGTGGVILTSESRAAQNQVSHALLSADDLKGTFGADSTLKAMIGVGHARMEQVTEAGTRQTTSGDRLEAQFTARQGEDARPAGQKSNSLGASEIDRAVVTGNVVLFQQPVRKAGSPEPPALKAMAARAEYDGAGELLHLIGNPRVENGGLELMADKIDVARLSNDAFAYGNVKATWFGDSSSPDAKPDARATGGQMAGLGAGGPTHVVAADAQLHQQTGEATFRGHARLWQQANSINAPVIVLDRVRQTLVARSGGPAEPVRVVLLSADKPDQSKASKTGSPSVIRVRGADLKYSDAERKAWMRGDSPGAAVAETGDATIRSSEMELTLFAPGNHAARDGGSAQVDTLTARGDVTIDSEGRRGTGDQLAYSSQTGEYVLTGTAARPPHMTDPARGTVTGGALIFNSRDDSVNVEGDGRQTTTDSRAPKRP